MRWQTYDSEGKAPVEGLKTLGPVNLWENVDYADVGGLPAVLDDEPGLDHLQRVRDQSSSNTSQSSGKYGSPLRDVTQFIHVKVNKSGDEERCTVMYEAKGNITFILFF